uniref:Uncharacterized protein n=1 Tax=Anguilla anguilla TaxID=7936 RepID=A0A0E9XA48_ANGAN
MVVRKNSVIMLWHLVNHC